MAFAYDHDKFVAKNRSLASAEEMNTKDKNLEKKGYSRIRENQEGSCFKCKFKNGCSEFRAKRSGGSTGVVSFGGNETFLCDKFVPAPSQTKTMSDRQIKSLLKNTRRTLH
ncbi:MAG: hypothetical protein JW915_08295 [Chitinispirillaceae bacterium]|nr:hypothetical protein [Chitinispirillaceae bacterium]